MYRKCTVDLVPKGVFRPPNAIGVNGEKQGTLDHQKTPEIIGNSEGFKLVAGAGFEPTTFRL